MRRFIPFIIAAVGVLALLVDLPSSVTHLTRPGTEDQIDTRLGLDLRGGLRGEYQATDPKGGKPSAENMQTIRTIIENRINSTGVAEPQVQTLGSDRIVVEIPGISDETQIRKLIGSTGRLDFVPIPPGTTVPSQGEAIDPKLPPLFTGDQLDGSKVGPFVDSQTGERGVTFTLKDKGARLFADYTSKNVGNNFAIVLDGIVQSAPVIRGAITGGTGQITGSFTPAEMNTLVNTLKFGALPLDLKEVGFNSISATLGFDFLRQSILAGIIGIGLVFIFMLVYYRLPGLVACIALIFYALVVYALFRVIPVTLTLAGVAAFVLSVGMAVDANILIFERTKEELRAGKTIQSAIEAGFNRAWNSILDSNVSSLITAVILFVAGSSVIRGFALVLIIGVLTSMFTAITLSRALLRVVVRQRWARKASLYGVHDDEFTVVAPRPGGTRREVGARV